MQASIGRARGWMRMGERGLSVAVAYVSRLLRPYSSNIAAITTP
ncbi:hypothetical protein HDG35_004016 [Paraburkholderia sp. JPY681]|nr:hypothetical protein [Paraburkholderia atlantica]